MPHHGSLARELRFDAENRLKNGELRAVVATASLELGIDIGSVDLVVQLGSPRSIAVALQRIGRSGHWVGAKPEGRLFATTRDELLECAALVRAIRGGAMDALDIPTRAARHPRAAARRRCAARRLGRDALYALGSRRVPVSRPAAQGLRRRARDARRRRRDLARPQRRVPAPRPRQRPAARAARRAHGGDHLGRRDPGDRELQRRRRARRPRRRHGRRRLRRREHGRRRLPARHDVVAGSAASSRASFASRTRTARRRRSRSGTARVSGRTIELSHEVALLRAGDRRARRRGRAAVADRRVRPRPRRRGAGRRVRARRQGGARHGADRHDDRRRALLRRRRRHAAHPAHAVRRAHQPRVGPRAAQEVLPLVQHRAAGGGDRQRHRASR